MPQPLRVVLTCVLLLAGSACTTAGPPPATAPEQPSGTPTALDTDCVDIAHGGQHLALDVVDGLHALDPDREALNADFVVDGDLSVEQVAWVLLGARVEKDAEGVIFVWATELTSRFPAIESMRRTIFESSGADVRVNDLELGRTTVAGLPAESAALPSDDGEYDAWTFTSGKTRFIVFAHENPHSGAFDLARRVPGLITAGSCPDA